MKGKLKYAVPVSTNETLLIGSVVDIIGSSETEYLCKSIDGKEFPVSKFALHIIDHTPIIDWEQRRYEIAKDYSMQFVMLQHQKGRTECGILYGDVVKWSIELADELIKQLKGGRK